MSLFDKIFRRPQREQVMSYFKTLTAYQPTFRKWGGKLYESEIVRAAIDARARHISKLQIKIHGAAQPRVQTILKKKPNQFQTWSQFLYRASTILDMQNTCFIVPIIDRNNDVVGLWTCLPSKCKVLEGKNGKEYLEYEFSTRDKGIVELNRCGILTKFQYESDFFGADQRALDETLDLIGIERQGIAEGIKSAASFRFMARLTNFKDPEDIAQEQKNFTARNLRADAGGFLLFPNTYDNIQQIQSKPYAISADDQNAIKANVFSYFGVNEEILTNTAAGSQLDAFFDGAIEPFSIQLSEVLTFMLFSDLEIAHGAKVDAEANRLQYMSTSDKINFIANLSDRGFITINEGRELLNYSPLPSEIGDRLPIRGEFKYVGEDQEEDSTEEPEEPAPEVNTNQPEQPAEGDENVDQN